MHLDIDQILEPGYQQGWDELVLPGDHKLLVQGMVQTHARASKSVKGKRDADLVPGKGEAGCTIPREEAYGATLTRRRDRQRLHHSSAWRSRCGKNINSW